MRKKTTKMDTVFILDRSGSMNGCVEDTIGGYNSYLSEQRKNKNTLITTVLFDDQYEVLYDRKPVTEVKDITRKEYFTRGCTALYDAIGKTINSLDSKNPEKVLFIITTDGLENASREYRKKDIQKLIKDHSNWEFLFIGANIDSYAEGANLGISRDNIANYEQSSQGVRKLFKSLSKASAMYGEDALDASWKQDLE